MKKKPVAKRKKNQPVEGPPLSPVLREGVLLAVSALFVFLLVALGTFYVGDPSWIDTGQGAEVHNAAGHVGANVAAALFFLIGYLAYVLPFVLAYYGWLIYRQHRIYSGIKEKPRLFAPLVHWGGFMLLLASTCALASLFIKGGSFLPIGSGGALGKGVSWSFQAAFSDVGAAILLIAALCTGLTAWTGFSWLRVVDWIGRGLWNLGEWLYVAMEWARDSLQGARDRQRRQEKQIKRTRKAQTQTKVRVEPVVTVVADPTRGLTEKQPELFESDSGELPPLSLLDPPLGGSHGYSKETVTHMSTQIEIKLEEFGIGVNVVEVIQGPVVTRFDLEPEAGVRGSKISGYTKDLARALSVVSVRIVEVVEGKSVIGLEVPNEDREVVRISEMLGSVEFNQSNSLLTLALGKGIDGQPIVCDLGKMPHLLVAGTTGSGKSVAINTMIMSLLYKTRPSDLRLILVDPKMLELGIYDEIPHLLTPVVTDMKRAAHALQWCVAEMDRRYTVMSKLGVRNVNGYNRKIEEAEKSGESVLDPSYEPTGVEEELPTLSRLPYIVVVIDEFADMMMVVGKKVEEYIIRLAQKARAAGIHLILATQRPTREVITGLIKSNIPSRIAFRVASNVDSRTILDQVGAEQLLGQGDMLFLDTGVAIPVRVHGAFISDDEVREVANHMREHGGEVHYLDEVTETEESSALPGGSYDEDDGDALYQEAIEVVRRDGKASISYLQRRLKVGYNRAASMMERMEEDGIVSAVQSGGGRTVLGMDDA